MIMIIFWFNNSLMAKIYEPIVEYVNISENRYKRLNIQYMAVVGILQGLGL